MPNQTPILRIAIASPLRRCFDYLPNTDSLPEDFAIGMRVAAPFGHQKSVVGIIIDITPRNENTHAKLRSIHYLLDGEAAPCLTKEILALCQWCSQYYHYPLGEVCHLALPALLRKPIAPPKPKVLLTWRLTQTGQSADNTLFRRAKKQREAWEVLQQHSSINEKQLNTFNISRSTLAALITKGLAETAVEAIGSISSSTHSPLMQEANNSCLSELALTLNAEQQHAISQINTQDFGIYLLEGVTGSGKTEVYLQTIHKILDAGKQVLVLVPEIGLTPQTVDRFGRRFNVPISTLHSGISDKQRLLQWQAAKQGESAIIIGTRSAVFTPLPRIGLIIVDEEHDLSYKQQEGVRYSARDTAIVRAQKNNIPIILGSATPSLETLHNAIKQRYQYLQLTTRATMANMPSIRCIEGLDDSLSTPIIEAIQQTLNQEQQALVFINRRGYAPTLICQDCGWISQCPNCDCRMTLHRQAAYPQTQYANQPLRTRLHCHHCDYKCQPPSACPECHSVRLQPLGQGTQRSEEELTRLFIDTPIIRIDRDSISRKGELESALAKINTNEPSILVGTQMLAKGHHFANVSLVVILGLDNSFFSSDFRGSERMGQLLTQVAGRAGREQHQGHVYIQTQFPEHPLLQQLIQEGYSALARQLLAERQLSHMPPYQHLALIRCHAPQASTAIQFLQNTHRQLQKIKAPSNTFQTIGPLPATIEKRNNRFYYYLQIKAQARSDLHRVISSLCLYLEQQKIPKGLHWLIDVDPQES